MNNPLITSKESEKLFLDVVNNMPIFPVVEFIHTFDLLPETIMNETELENEIQVAGLNAPRLTPEAIDGVIVSEAYYQFPDTTVTVCLLSLRNGFSTVGHSACVSPENFDVSIGRKIARDNARNKIWELEGYLLRQQLSGQGS